MHSQLLQEEPGMVGGKNEMHLLVAIRNNLQPSVTVAAAEETVESNKLTHVLIQGTVTSLHMRTGLMEVSLFQILLLFQIMVERMIWVALGVIILAYTVDLSLEDHNIMDMIIVEITMEAQVVSTVIISGDMMMVVLIQEDFEEISFVKTNIM